MTVQDKDQEEDNEQQQLTRNESKRQYKQQVCTDKTIQKQGVLGCTNTMMMNEKWTMGKDARWASRRELAD